MLTAVIPTAVAQRWFAPRPGEAEVAVELVEDEEYEPARRRPAHETP